MPALRSRAGSSRKERSTGYHLRAIRMEKKKSSLLAVIRRLLPWVAIGCVILALLPRTNELRQCLERLSLGWLVPALGLCLAYWFLNAGTNHPRLRRSKHCRSSFVRGSKARITHPIATHGSRRRITARSEDFFFSILIALTW